VRSLARGLSLRGAVLCSAKPGKSFRGEPYDASLTSFDLDRGVLIINARTGSLHESAHTRWLGSPKTASSARTITLPPFLVTMLHKHLDRHDNEFVFTAEGGTWLWRSTFIRRVLKPAVNGNEECPQSGVRKVPIRPGLTFHGLRHSHKTG